MIVWLNLYFQCIVRAADTFRLIFKDYVIELLREIVLFKKLFYIIEQRPVFPQKGWQPCMQWSVYSDITRIR